jgi:hypothetical protein
MASARTPLLLLLLVFRYYQGRPLFFFFFKQKILVSERRPFLCHAAATAAIRYPFRSFEFRASVDSPSSLYSPVFVFSSQLSSFPIRIEWRCTLSLIPSFSFNPYFVFSPHHPGGYNPGGLSFDHSPGNEIQVDVPTDEKKRKRDKSFACVL